MKKFVIWFFALSAVFIMIAEPVQDIKRHKGTPKQVVEVAEPVVYEDEHESEKVENAIDWHYLDGVTLTAYCSCYECCGEYALDRPGGIVYTASGAVAQAGQTIAVDPDVIPLGAWVEIDGNLYHAEDTGDFGGNHVDIYFNSHEDALDFGRQTADLRWYE